MRNKLYLPLLLTVVGFYPIFGIESQLDFITYNTHNIEKSFVGNNVGTGANGAVCLLQEVGGDDIPDLVSTALAKNFNCYIGTSQYGGNSGEFLPIFWPNSLYKLLYANSFLGVEKGWMGTGTTRVFNLVTLEKITTSGPRIVITVINYHLDNWSADGRKREWEEICRRIGENWSRWRFDVMVLGGDSNGFDGESMKNLINLNLSIPNSGAIESYAGGYVSNGVSGIDGFTIFIPYEKLDTGTFGQQLKKPISWVSFRGLGARGSDHEPVYINFKLNAKRTGPRVQESFSGGFVGYRDINYGNPITVWGFQASNDGGAGALPFFRGANDSISSFRLGGQVRHLTIANNSDGSGDRQTYTGSQRWVGEKMNDIGSWFEWSY